MVKLDKISHPVSDVIMSVLLGENCRRATKYLEPDRVVTATARRKRDQRSERIEIVLKIGAPNFRERAFVKACQKAGEPFPVQKVQLRFFK